MEYFRVIIGEIVIPSNFILCVSNYLGPQIAADWFSLF